MARQPILNSDQNNWGSVLNTYLSVTHTAAGNLNTTVWFGDAADTNLYRSAANHLRTDEAFSVVGNAGIGFGVRVDPLAAPAFQGLQTSGNLLIGNKLLTADANQAFSIGGDGTINWGAGGASAVDTNLQRASGGVLKTNGNINFANKALTYSTSITPDASGRWNSINVTNTTAFTINAPANAPDSSHTTELTIEVTNSSGGAMGAITWNAIFLFAGFTWTNPASTKRRYASFRWNGTGWVCAGIASADY